MVILAQPNTPEWLEQRRSGIGASEIAAVMGISPWESPLSLYWRKVNGWENEANTSMSTGTRLEPVIAEWGAEQVRDDCERWLPVEIGVLIASPDRPWQMATPDRIVYDYCPRCEGHGIADSCGGACPSCKGSGCGERFAVLECKWTGSWDGWGEPGSDDIPVYYRTQVLWQCDVLGVDRWYVAVLGPSGFRLYQGRQDQRDLEVMLEHGRRFMDRLARRDPPPIDDHTATLTTLKRLHPDITEDEAEVDEDIAAGYARAVRMERLAKQAKARYEAALRSAMGGAHYATAGGRKVATRVITEVAGYTVGDHTKDYLLPPKGKKP